MSRLSALHVFMLRFACGFAEAHGCLRVLRDHGEVVHAKDHGQLLQGIRINAPLLARDSSRECAWSGRPLGHGQPLRSGSPGSSRPVCLASFTTPPHPRRPRCALAHLAGRLHGLPRGATLSNIKTSSMRRPRYLFLGGISVSLAFSSFWLLRDVDLNFANTQQTHAAWRSRRRVPACATLLAGKNDWRPS